MHLLRIRLLLRTVVLGLCCVGGKAPTLSTVEVRVYSQTCGLVLRVSLTGKGLGPLVF